MHKKALPIPGRPGFSLVELLIVIAIIGILTGLLLPAVQSSREATRRLSCQNNMRQLGIALHNFESAYGKFPASGWTEAGPGNPAGVYVGWRALTLPFLEQSNTQQLYDFESHWWEGTNPTVAAVPIPTFLCPSVPQHVDVLQAIAKPPRPQMTFANPIAPTDYEAIMGVQPASINPHLGAAIYNRSNRFSVLHRNSRTTFGQITDGSSHTIMIVECGGRPTVYRNRREQPSLFNDQGIGWADSEGPFSLDGARVDGSQEGCGPAGDCTVAMNARNDNEPYSFHLAGGNFLYADGHVSLLDQG
ncbi:MAG: DUF1559 domain-containing protein, partial [bacterium]|nr:DUF1559 domain-containing protein [bacterium]